MKKMSDGYEATTLKEHVRGKMPGAEAMFLGDWELNPHSWGSRMEAWLLESGCEDYGYSGLENTRENVLWRVCDILAAELALHDEDEEERR